MTEIQYTLQEKDLIAFNAHELEENVMVLKAIRRNQATVPGIIVLIALFYWFWYQDVFSAGYIATIGVTWGVLVPIYLRWNVLNQIRKKYTPQDKKKLLGDYTLRIHAKALEEITPNGKATTDWSEVLRIDGSKNKKYVFIYMDADAALIIPVKSVTEGNIRKFINEADERIMEAA